MVRRRAAMAGSWYPESSDSLRAEVDAHLAQVHPGAPGGPPQAIVVPHAGLAYSGSVAAFAYSAVQGRPYGAVVLVGPSHFVTFDGVSIWPAGAWETPLGPVTVDETLAAAISYASPLIGAWPAAHMREHSLEMQLPFIARVLPGVPIVPLVMGRQTRGTVDDLSRAIARAVSARMRATAMAAPPVLLVASSDLSHYEEASTAFALDHVVIDRVTAFDDAGLMEVLEREPSHACGGGPIVSVLHAARLLGATRAELLRYADSGDVTGDKSSVVGYMAAAIW